MPILRNTKMNYLQTTESFDLNKFSNYSIQCYLQHPHTAHSTMLFACCLMSRCLDRRYDRCDVCTGNSELSPSGQSTAEMCVTVFIVEPGASLAMADSQYGASSGGGGGN